MADKTIKNKAAPAKEATIMVKTTQGKHASVWWSLTWADHFRSLE
jgi:hypothetical protein